VESKEICDQRVREVGRKIGFTKGYKILYALWATIGMTDTISFR
jgi:hypothetical protein